MTPWCPCAGIDRETDLGSYDVSVRSKRKKGIGSEDPKGVGQDIFTVQPYEPEPLGWLVESIWAGARSMASAINNHGLIAGSAVDAAWNWTAVAWNPGAEPVTFGGLHSHATATNNRGWIVGSRGMDLGYHDIPFILENGVLAELEQFHPPFISQPLAINEAGTIVGYGARDDWADPTWPLIWRRNPDGTYGAPEQLPLPDDQQWEIDQHQEGSQAAAIDDRGDVVGTLRFGWLPGQFDQAVLWRVRADGTYDEPLILGGMNGRARGINNAGLVVGSIDNGQGREAVVWHPRDYSTPIKLGRAELWSEAVAVNDAGQVVGHAERSDAVYGGVPIGVLWTVGIEGRTVDQIDLASPPGYSHSRPRALNAHGWVVGMSEQFQPYRMMATLWRPEEQ
jgi:uncharacterized membrane protein